MNTKLVGSLTLVGCFAAFTVVYIFTPKENQQTKSLSSTNSDLTQIVDHDKHAGVRIVGFKETPTQTTCNSITYKLSQEVELKPGESFYFSIPSAYRNRNVSQAMLAHRQDPTLPSNQGYHTGGYTTPPGLTSFQVRGRVSANSKNEWRYYQNPSQSGTKGAKFAAPGYQPENERLYGWCHSGHASDATDQTAYTPLITGEALRMMSVGQNPVLLDSITLQVQAPPATNNKTVVFSPNTTFGDECTEQGRNYGGGQGHYGHFPKAIVLGYSGSQPSNLPADWKVQGNRMIIPLEANKSISSIQVAVGDTHPDYDPKDPNAKPNEDGGYGSSGWSKLSIAIQHADGSVDRMVNRDNVPPQAVITGSPTNCDYVTQAGDKVIITADDDTAYVMAVNIGTRPPVH